MPYTLAYIGLGANLSSEYGVPFDTVRMAMHLLNSSDHHILVRSRLFSTPCFPAGAGPDYVNACAALSCPGDAQSVLAHLHAVEAACGRERRDRWGARTIDLDLLAFGDAVLPDRAVFDHWRALPVAQQMRETPDQLILPHPRLQDRPFVLVPLCDIAPDWRHPVLGASAATLCAALPEAERAQVCPITAAEAPAGTAQ